MSRGEPGSGQRGVDQLALFNVPQRRAEDVERAAVLSECARYRYVLTRTWDHDLAPCVFIGLNPSTADAMNDDPTIRRCIRFARDWGHGGLVMLNLFAWRATDPKRLLDPLDPVGPRNNDLILEWTLRAGRVVGAWGATHPQLVAARVDTLRSSGDLPPYDVLGRTAAGFARHPLYVGADVWPQDGRSLRPALSTCAGCGHARSLYDDGETCERCVEISFAEAG